MKLKVKYSQILFLTLTLAYTTSSYCQKESTIITIKSNTKNPIINKHIYGHFAEHLGRSIYGGFYVGDSSKIPNTFGV